MRLCFFFFNDTATTEIYPLSLHDALPISGVAAQEHRPVGLRLCREPHDCGNDSPLRAQRGDTLHLLNPAVPAGANRSDRKSTRLNSSHANISYAVFCLKKKKLLT